jgi:hypothetical protein
MDRWPGTDEGVAPGYAPRTASLPPASLPPARAGDNWWLRLTSYGLDRPQRTIEERERVRRSQLASWILLAFLIVDVLLIPIGLSDATTMVAIVVVFAGLLGGILLNRLGQVAFAGWLVVALVDLGVMASLFGGGDPLTVDSLPAYDLMLAAVVIAASVLGPGAAAFVAAGNIALICGDFFLQPHAPDLVADLAVYPSPTVGVLALLGRPVALHLLIAVVAILWVAGTEREIRRADRAEELAALEHAVAEQRRQLEQGVAQLLQTHVRLANGDFSARAPTLQQDNMLWQVAASLNNLINRMQRMAGADAEMQRAADEARRLLVALRNAQAGRQPLWPAPSGTLVDPLIQFFRGVSAPGGTPPPPVPPAARPSGWGGPSSARSLPNQPDQGEGSPRGTSSGAPADLGDWQWPPHGGSTGFDY